MADTDSHHLRVLIANEKRDRLELLAQVVIGLGHDVIAREIYVKEVGPSTAREAPDVALVGLGSSSEHALELISEIVREASCPVIAILHADDPAYIHEAAKRGVVRLHHRWQPRRAAERDRHHPATVQRVPEPAGSIRTPGNDRTGKRDPYGPATRSAQTPRSNGFATIPSTTAADSATSPPPSSKATSCSSRHHNRPRLAHSGLPSLVFGLPTLTA